MSSTMDLLTALNELEAKTYIAITNEIKSLFMNINELLYSSISNPVQRKEYHDDSPEKQSISHSEVASISPILKIENSDTYDAPNDVMKESTINTAENLDFSNEKVIGLP